MKNKTSDLQVSEFVIINTKSTHRGETGQVHSYTAKKVCVLFPDSTIVAFYDSSLRRIQTTPQRHKTENNNMENNKSNLRVGELVIINTKSAHRGETGQVHSYTEKKVRVLFPDSTIVAFYECSLRRIQMTPQRHKTEINNMENNTSNQRVGELIIINTKSAHRGNLNRIEKTPQNQKHTVKENTKTIQKPMLPFDNSDIDKFLLNLHTKNAILLKRLLFELILLFQKKKILKKIKNKFLCYV